MSKPTKILLLEDDFNKAIDVKSTLRTCGIQDVIWEVCQDAGFERIYEYAQQGNPIQLIITDMHYPLRSGEEADREAGFKLLERLKQEQLSIPVIICSTGNFQDAVSEVLGVVCYNPNRDLFWDLKTIIDKM